MKLNPLRLVLSTAPLFRSALRRPTKLEHEHWQPGGPEDASGHRSLHKNCVSRPCTWSNSSASGCTYLKVRLGGTNLKMLMIRTVVLSPVHSR